MTTDLYYPILTIFFTLNGKLVKSISFRKENTIFSGVPIYPAIGSDTYNLIEVNTGQSPFKFDVFTFERETFINLDMKNNANGIPIKKIKIDMEGKEDAKNIFNKFSLIDLKISEDMFNNFVNIRNTTLKKVYDEIKLDYNKNFVLKNDEDDENDENDDDYSSADGEDQNVDYEEEFSEDNDEDEDEEGSEEDNENENDQMDRDIFREFHFHTYNYVYPGIEFTKNDYDSVELPLTRNGEKIIELLEMFRSLYNIYIDNKKYEKQLLICASKYTSFSSSNSFPSPISNNSESNIDFEPVTLSKYLNYLFELVKLNNVLKSNNPPTRFSRNLISNYYQETQNGYFPTFFNLDLIIKSFTLFVSYIFIFTTFYFNIYTFNIPLGH